jgi:hypothetical protein
MLLILFAQICRETGKEHMVKVHSGEGLANHSGPEPCGGLCEETDEKSVGAHVGEVLRRESCESRAPTPVGEWKATLEGAPARVPFELCAV